MVRRTVEIKEIEDKAKRQTTFTKRRQGLFKKAEELGKKCDIDIAVIAFSKAGNLYATGNPSVNAVIDRYIRYKSSMDGETEETKEGSQADQVEKSNKKDSTLQPLSTDQKIDNNEVAEILVEIEEIERKILSLAAEDSKPHGLDRTVAELEDMKRTMEEINARTGYTQDQG